MGHSGAEGSLWVGTYGSGLDGLDRESRHFVHHRHDPNDPSSLSDDRILALYRDRSETLWIGTAAAGLERFDLGHGFLHPGGLGQNAFAQRPGFRTLAGLQDPGRASGPWPGFSSESRAGNWLRTSASRACGG